MLCERFPGDIQELMQSDVLYMETKMDGERFQLHIDRGRFMYISRNGVDYTRNFGMGYDQGTLTPKLRGLLPLGLESIILDGEMMVWDTNQLRFREKGENTDVKSLKPEGSWQPCFVVYDLLYFNGQSLLDHTYIQRAYKLQKMIVEQPGVLQLMRARKIGSVEEFNELFQQALDSHAEGIVLKKQGSRYQPGVRLGGGWYKDKADVSRVHFRFCFLNLNILTHLFCRPVHQRSDHRVRCADHWRLLQPQAHLCGLLSAGSSPASASWQLQSSRGLQHRRGRQQHKTAQRAKSHA